MRWPKITLTLVCACVFSSSILLRPPRLGGRKIFFTNFLHHQGSMVTHKLIENVPTALRTDRRSVRAVTIRYRQENTNNRSPQALSSFQDLFQSIDEFRMLWLHWATDRKVWYKMAVTCAGWPSKRPFWDVIPFYASSRVTKACETRLSSETCKMQDKTAASSKSSHTMHEIIFYSRIVFLFSVTVDWLDNINFKKDHSMALRKKAKVRKITHTHLSLTRFVWLSGGPCRCLASRSRR